MEYYDSPPPITIPDKCCDCGCSRCSSLNRSFPGMVLRSVKRKFEEFEEENHFSIPGLDIPQIARVEIENECVALRETLVSQQETIQDLVCELEEERNASSSAANETMSMILRLQREKAEIEMEAKQFKRFTEEKISHDQQEILELEELLYKREHTIEALTCEIQAYKHRLMSYGLTEAEAEAEVDELCKRNEEKITSSDNSMTTENQGQPMLPGYEIYPPLKCKVYESHSYLDDYEEADDVDKHAFAETPCSRNELKDLERRINHLENTPRTIQPDGEYISANKVFEKVIVGQSPRQPSHVRRFSNDNPNSPLAVSPKLKKTEYPHLDANSNVKKVDNALKAGDVMINRVCTVDSFNQRTANGVKDYKTSAGIGGDDNLTTPWDSEINSNVKDVEIQKLYARLHALETDRETMRQAIVSIGTDKAQLMLLKEIAQNLCKEMAPSRAMPVQERSIVKSFSFVSLFKWAISVLLWRRNARRSRYTFGLSANNAGLLSLVNRNPQMGPGRVMRKANMQSLKELQERNM